MEESLVSENFRKITDGLYKEVKFKEDKILVKRTDEKELTADKLSGGAYDQLYLSIRIALAERVLDEKGFFIMDDPFIKSDIYRLQSQINILKELSMSGWQIIYFSAKEEIKNILEKDLNKQHFTYIEIPPLFS